jgi:hypothetical protein
VLIFSVLDGKLSELFFDTVSLITNLDEDGNKIDGLGYYRYRAIEFLTKEEVKKMYGNVESISGRLSAIMKTLLVKRLESSFYAFTQSLSRFKRAIDNMLGMFEENRVFIAPDLDINKLLEEGLSYDEIEAKIEEKGEGALFGNKIQKEESEILKYLNELRDFRKKHPKIFNDISKIPNKARCGRNVPEGKQLTLLDTETGEINYPLQNTSLTYLKSENHPGIFCLITPEMNIIEMNFLQAVKLFKAPETEKAITLHELHHKQTLAGFEYFKSEKNQENVKTVSRKNLSPAENKAISNFEQIIDGMVYELYFPELLKKHNREVIEHLGELPQLKDDISDEQKMKICKKVFDRLNDAWHPVKINLEKMKEEIPEIAIIEGGSNGK